MTTQTSKPSTVEVVHPESPTPSFQQPTAAEVSDIAFRKLQEGIHAQELSNQFARLLNRGSSLE